MSTPWFFLSYASISDRSDKEVEEFSSDLVGALRDAASLKKNEISAGDIGFYAPEMPEGANWSEELVEKLRSCRVLVCLYSDSYFRSPACGKEFKIFSSRIDAYVDALEPAQRPQLILPVLWTTPTDFPNKLPRAASELHYDNTHLDKLLNVGGLFYLKTLATDKSEYNQYVVHLARTIRKVAEKPVLPLLDRVPLLFEETWNAWVDPPAAPSGLDAAEVVTRQIRLTWEGNSADEKGFYIERLRKGGRANNFVNVKELPPSSSSFTDKVAASGTTYEYRVCAYNSGGCSEYTQVIEVETSGQPPPPMPSNLSAVAVSPRQVELRWVDNSGGIGSFKIQRCDGSDRRRFSDLEKVHPGVTSYNDFELTPATTYVYRLRASDDNGDSDFDEVTIKTPEPPPPPPPKLPYLIAAAAAAVVIIVATGLIFRCSIVPSFCAVQAPPPATSPTTTKWDDRFMGKADGDEHGWIKDGDWDYPRELWTTATGRDGSEADRALVVQGTTPGFTRKAFNNFEAKFTISYLQGTRVGWFLRSGPGASQSSRYKFVLVKGAQPSAGFYLYGQADGAPESKLSPPTCWVPISEYGEPNDYIKVVVTAIKNEIIYKFTLMNPNPITDRRTTIKTPITVGCEPFRDEGKSYIISGHLGFFAEGATVFKVEELFIEPN